MYQDDSFGREGFRGVRRALERRELSLVAVGVYPRNTKAVKTALLDLRSGQPQSRDLGRDLPAGRNSNRLGANDEFQSHLCDHLIRGQ